MDILIKRYAPSLLGDWSNILTGSRNGVFLFDRSFVEYHGDRFIDFSAIAYVDEEPVALLPASIDVGTGRATSHSGLTFGGIVLRRELRGTVAILVINELLNTLKDWGAATLTVKLLPQSFCTYPSAEVEYALWRRGFSLMRRDLSSILPLCNALAFNTSKLHSIKKARKAGVIIGPVSIAKFYSLLAQVLLNQHGLSPTHSLVEMTLLANRFPDRIFVRAATLREELVAGTLIFNYGHIWHTQYLASSDAGRAVGGWLWSSH